MATSYRAFVASSAGPHLPFEFDGPDDIAEIVDRVYSKLENGQPLRLGTVVYAANTVSRVHIVPA